MGIERLAAIGSKLRGLFGKRGLEGVGDTQQSAKPPLTHGISVTYFGGLSGKKPEQGLNPTASREISEILESAEKKNSKQS